MSVTYTIKANLPTWNDIAGWAWKGGRQYEKSRKIAMAIIKSTTTPKEVPPAPWKVTFVWHSSTKHDLGNLMAGEKHIVDALMDIGAITDDINIIEECHKYKKDTSNYVEVTISTKYKEEKRRDV